MISFSIITVTYNSEQTLSKAIESVLNQTYKPREYFVIDGLSSDRTVEIAESYRAGFEEKGIVYKVVSEKDKGMYDALNKGAGMATGDFVGQINSDDWYEKEALETVAEAYEEEPFDMSFADLRMINIASGKTWVKKARVTRFVNTHHWNHPTQFTRREVLLKKPYACACMSDDLDLMLWIRKSGYKVKALNRVLANFTMGGMSHKKDWKAVVECIRNEYRIYTKNGYSPLYIVDKAALQVAKYILQRF